VGEGEIEFQVKGYMDEFNLGYNTEMEGYMNFNSDITKLYAIVSKRLETTEDIINMKHMHI
jgi:hypothetical protein